VTRRRGWFLIWFRDWRLFDHGNEDDSEGNDDDDDDDDDDDNDDTTFLPASSVPQLCAQLRTNDPSVLPGGRNEVFEPNVPDSCRLMIAEALLQNTGVRCIGLELQDDDELSSDAMAKYRYLAQSKHLLANNLSQDLTGSRQQNFLSTFIEAIGPSNSVTKLNLCKALTSELPVSLFKTCWLERKSSDIYESSTWKEEGLWKRWRRLSHLAFPKNATLREIELLDCAETSRTVVLTSLRDHPVLEKLTDEGFSSLLAIGTLLRGKNSQLKKLVIGHLNKSTGEQVVGFESFIQEMGRNATILNMAIRSVCLNRDNIQQLKGHAASTFSSTRSGFN
jgi:hypothetical protein